MPYLRDFQGIRIARSIRQTSNVNSGNMKTEKYIENMTIFEYIEYEARMKKQYVHPTRSEGVDFSYLSSKSVAKEYLYYSDEAKIDLYYELPLLLPYFQPIQPRAKSGYESPYVDIVGDTDSIAEYESEEAEREPNKHTEQTVNEWIKTEIKKYKRMESIRLKRNVAVLGHNPK
ncbi:hypothetical protein Tco_1368159 [Tanacetum coccineum]